VVQGALKLILEPIFEADFQAGSYGYRPKRMAQRCLKSSGKSFRQYVSWPVENVIAKINPILRGWVNYFRVGHSSSCFSMVKTLGREEGQATSDACPGTQRLWLEAVE